MRMLGKAMVKHEQPPDTLAAQALPPDHTQLD
jgi:hypothetical protein